MIKFGYSIYFSQFLKDGFSVPSTADVIFTSLHDAEEFGNDFSENIQKFLKVLLETGKIIIADISPRGISAFGAKSLADFASFGKNFWLRCDFGFSCEDLLEVAKSSCIVTNASSPDWVFGKKFSSFAKVLACHNFYPRPETGLDVDFFNARNAILRQNGMEIAAFISGDEKRRFPIYKGLPTLEFMRDLPPYVQFVLMAKKFKIDFIIVGDGGISKMQDSLINDFRSDGILRIPAFLDKSLEFYYDKVLTCRPDSPADLIRVQESREYATNGKTVSPKNCIERKAGDITVDNEFYLRYSGEVQIMRKDFPACEKVNVAGHIKKEYLNLLDALDRGEKFMLIRQNF